MSEQQSNWFCYKPVGQLGDLICPSCKKKIKFGSIFDHDPRPCQHCGIVLVEWNVNSGVYVVAEELAPDLIRNIISYLAPKDEYAAGYEIQGLINFLCKGDDYFTKYSPSLADP